LHSASLSSCCGYHPASVSRRISQIAPVHAAFARHPRARPLELDISRPPLPLLPLRPDDSLPILTMALSMDSQSSVSLSLAIQATGLLTFAPVGLTAPLNTPAFRDLSATPKDRFPGHTGDVSSPPDAVGSVLFGERASLMFTDVNAARPSRKAARG